MPVLKHFDGVCHVYVDAAADLDVAERIVVNAKCQRPGDLQRGGDVCSFTPPSRTNVFRALARALAANGVELRGCEQTRRLVPTVRPATEADYRTEYLDLVISVKVVADIDEAVAHIASVWFAPYGRDRHARSERGAALYATGRFSRGDGERQHAIQ